MMGIACGAFEYDWEEAQRWFRLAVAREPIPPMVRLWHALFYLAPIGQTNAAVEEFRLAVQHDPVSALMRVCYGVCLTAAGRFSEAEAEYHQALDIDPSNVLPYSAFIQLLVKRGGIAEALELAERASALFPWFPPSRVQLGTLLRQAGQMERANKLLHDMDQGDEVGAARSRLYFHLTNNEPQQAAPWLERLVESRFVSAVTLRMFQSLYPSPYWAAVAKKMNLPES